ncbi:hypothetical protein [Anseongella ginsenosidimutans]|uniref:hypothetical protein n=1 Tax=Anseongella ginsenosidimutans TaxID=496056 RepID=UPI0011C94045|nr:hypothetical protein [Anseongella ginsenosidimutans]QEC50901.1 hypothetical protein FRZ59_00010 [Anseongella ginsenosidimutans]
MVANKYGIQLGFKTFDLFRVKDLNWLLEFNTVRPYTYSQRDPLINYAHYNQPLGHPREPTSGNCFPLLL